MIETKHDIDTQEIINLSGIHPLKVKNIYIYGSQIYGTNRPDSDYDVIMVAGNLLEHQEIKSEKYNIHIHTHDKFKRELLNHDIHNLECIFAPDWAKLQEKENYNFALNKDKLKKTLLSQSHNSWHKAKMKFLEGDAYNGNKSGFHALRILMFGIQVAEYGKIINYSAANDLFYEIDNSNFYDWDQFKNKYLDYKKELENTFKLL